MPIMYLNISVTIVIVLSHILLFNLFAQQKDSIAIKGELLTVRSQGIAYLGSGITEEDAKVIATNDAKRIALEQTGMYLESHTKVINYTLVKDEIITISGSILRTKIISENRKILNNLFAIDGPFQFLSSLFWVYLSSYPQILINRGQNLSEIFWRSYPPFVLPFIL